MFRHYRVILRVLVISALLSYTSMSNEDVVIQFKIEIFHIRFRQVLIIIVEISVFKIFKILKLSYL
jgi:hypothetical protein